MNKKTEVKSTNFIFPSFRITGIGIEINWKNEKELKKYLNNRYLEIEINNIRVFLVPILFLFCLKIDPDKVKFHKTYLPFAHPIITNFQNNIKIRICGIYKSKTVNIKLSISTDRYGIIEMEEK